jgi:hypothetical protein
MNSSLLQRLGTFLDRLLSIVLCENYERQSEANYNAELFLRKEANEWSFIYAGDLYSVCLVTETEEAGYVGYELMQTREGLFEGRRVGRILRWDANGQLTFETLDGYVLPVQVVEALITKAKCSI